MKSAPSGDRRLLMVGALGVVFGDIGTSPLYAVQQCFSDDHGISVTPEHIIGVMSMMIWTLVLVVCVKYVGFVLRADNRGEGGILALLTLTFGDAKTTSRRRAALIVLGVFGACLLYGDGMITPCITVMSACDGLALAFPSVAQFVVPISITVLILLFWFQHTGTHRVGGVLGPIMVVWFVTLAVLGVRGIVLGPEVLKALLPWYALDFLAHEWWSAFSVIGTMFLAVTGAEALYADLGHFGKRPIQRAWFFVAFPGLLLNYLGQGGLLLSDPLATKPFFQLAPGISLYALVALTFVASAIASQALITGTYSITMQAIQLGWLPRMEIRHTSPDERGQIYLPHVNWLLMIGCIAVCLGFRSSAALASAYGIAVTTTMLITTVLFYFAAHRVFGWPAWRAGLFCLCFVLLEGVFFSANAVKIWHGGWLPLLVAFSIFTVMYTWKAGRRVLYQRYSAQTTSIESLLESLGREPPIRVPGTAVYMAGSTAGAPLALLHNLKHNKVLHQKVILLTIQTVEDPHVPDAQRVRVETLSLGFHRVVAQYGFMERPRVPELLRLIQEEEVRVRISETTFFLSRETIVPARRRRMARWRSVLFAFLSRNAQPATTFFGLPANRVVELGVQVEF